MTSTRRTALVTGITGQDGYYLSKLLLGKGYRVVGLTRQVPKVAGALLDSLAGRVELRTLDLAHHSALASALRDVAPDEVYHLAAQSVVHASWDAPVATAEATAIGALRLLDAVRTASPGVRVLIASSCEIFGRPAETPQSETTPIRPTSPYGIAKSFAYWMTATYRGTHGLFAASAILYNHESPRRSTEFVTRKITNGVARIVAGEASSLSLGNLEARRDWGFAGDYVDAMWRMLQAEAPEDFVIGTGESHSVRDFCDAAFRIAGLDYGKFVEEDPRLFRPADARELVANPARARERLGWSPRVGFAELVEMMARADLERVLGQTR